MANSNAFFGGFTRKSYIHALISSVIAVSLGACSSHTSLSPSAEPVAKSDMGAVMTSEEFKAVLSQSQRHPADVSPFGGKSGDELIEQIIFDQAPITKYIPPVWFFTNDILIGKAKDYVDNLDMSGSKDGEKIKAAIRARLDSKTFVDELIPFIFAIKDLYMLSDEDYQARKFHTWAQKAIPDHSIPGYWNELFPNPAAPKASGEAAKTPAKESGGLLTGKMAAAAAEVYYDLFLKEKNTGLNEEFVESKEIVDALVQKITGIVGGISSGGGGGESDSLLSVITSDEVRKEGVAIALVKFIHTQKYKHYHMLVDRQMRRMQLKYWLVKQGRKYIDNPNSKSGQQFLRYLKEVQSSKRFGMEVVVDGLQGGLVQALTFPRENLAYLEALRRDRQEGLKIAADNNLIPGASAAVTHASAEFLDYLIDLAKKNQTPPPEYMRYFREKVFHGDTNAASIAKFGVSSTPTISVRNIPIALTGAAHTGANSIGLPNFHFVDRDSANPQVGIEARIEAHKASEVNRINKTRKARGQPLLEYHKNASDIRDRAYYFYGSDAMMMEDINAINGLKTMPDRLSSLDTFTCTSPYDNKTKFGFDAFINVFMGEKIDKRDYFESTCLRELRARGEKELEARKVRVQLIAEAEAIAKDASRKKDFLDRIPLLGDLKQFIEDQGSQLLGPKYEFLDLIEQLSEFEGETLPQYVQFYDPFPDHFAHGQGPYVDSIIGVTGEYNRLSYILGQFYEVYAHAGVVDRTLFGMAGDHGLTPVYRALNPEVAVFDQLRTDQKAWSVAGCKGERSDALGPCDFKVRKISSDEGEGPKINNPWRPNDPIVVNGKKVNNENRGKDVIIASTAGGNYMMDFFKGHDDASWKVQPYYKDLLNLRLLSGQTYNVPDSLYKLLETSLDYMAIRDDVPKDIPQVVGAVRVIGPREQKVGDRMEMRRQDALIYSAKVKGDPKNTLRLFYEQLTDADLLNITVPNPYLSGEATPKQVQSWIGNVAQCMPPQVNKADPTTWCTDDQWKGITMYTERQDSVYQLAQLYDSDLPGTVNLFPKKFLGYNTSVPGRHAGESFAEKDAFVGFWGEPTRKTGKRIPSVRNGSLPPTIYEWLMQPKDMEKVDGFAYPSVLKAVIREK